jgi:hypothetical protein
MNIDLPATVRQYANATGVHPTTVYRSIKAGAIEVDAELSTKAGRKMIVAGDLLWDIGRWKREIGPHIAHIKPHLLGWTADGALQILSGTSIIEIPRGYGERDLISAVKAIPR